MPDDQKSAILLVNLSNIRLDLSHNCNKTTAHLYEINNLT